MEVNIAPHCVQSKSNFFKNQFYIFLFWWADDEDNMYIYDVSSEVRFNMSILVKNSVALSRISHIQLL